jgi:hypothetical protein
LKSFPQKQKFNLDKSKAKVTLQVFFDTQDFVHYEFIPEGDTITKEMYVKILHHVRDAVRRKRLEKCTRNSWCLLHNVPAHWSLVVKITLPNTI